MFKDNGMFKNNHTYQKIYNELKKNVGYVYMFENACILVDFPKPYNYKIVYHKNKKINQIVPDDGEDYITLKYKDGWVKKVKSIYNDKDRFKSDNLYDRYKQMWN